MTQSRASLTPSKLIEKTFKYKPSISECDFLDYGGSQQKQELYVEVLILDSLIDIILNDVEVKLVYAYDDKEVRELINKTKEHVLNSVFDNSKFSFGNDKIYYNNNRILFVKINEKGE